MEKHNIQYHEYRIKGGDSLSLIISRMFGAVPRDARYKEVLNHLLVLNPQIKDINRIRAGDLLRLGVLPTPEQPKIATPTLQPKLLQKSPTFAIERVPPKDIEDFWMLSWLAQNVNYLTIPGGVAVGLQGNLLSPGNVSLITQINNHYADYKVGKITKGQYDYLRKMSLDKLKNNIGPFEKMLFGEKTPHEVIRIARGGGIPANTNIIKHSDRLTKLAAVGKAGGYVLVGGGVAASCKQIADTQSRAEKNEIFVETIASTSLGLVSGAMIGLFLVSNPIGWGTALVLATGSAAISYASGKGARKAYKLSGTEVDFVSGLGVDSVCR